MDAGKEGDQQKRDVLCGHRPVSTAKSRPVPTMCVSALQYPHMGAELPVVIQRQLGILRDKSVTYLKSYLKIYLKN